MELFTRILVPVDFSPGSKLALGRALSLAERFSAEIEVLHAWGLPAYLRPDLTVWVDEVTSTLEDHARREAEKCMQEFLQDFQLVGKKGVSSRLVYGSAAAVVLGAASESRADLIVLGTHGRTGLPRFFLGSVAEQVVRHAGCPVLTVRTPTAGPGDQPPDAAPVPAIRNLLVPTDFGESARQATETAITLAAKYDARITLVHAYELFPNPYAEVSSAASDLMAPIRDIASRSLDGALAELRKRAPTARGMMRQGTAWKEIVKTAQEEHSDLIVMGTEGRGGLTHALLGSVAEKVVRHSPVPVLTTRARAAV